MTQLGLPLVIQGRIYNCTNIHTQKNSPQIVGRVADDARNVCSNSVQKITEGQQRFSFNILVIHTP